MQPTLICPAWEVLLNQVLETNALSVEGILYWSYGVSNRSDIRSPKLSDEMPGRGFLRIQDLRVDAAFVQREINGELRWPHLRAIIEAKYGERPEAVRTCATLLKNTARTQSVDQLVRIVESYCEWHKLSYGQAAKILGLSAHKSVSTKSRYEGILEGWHHLALDIVEMVFREKGWVE